MVADVGRGGPGIRGLVTRWLSGAVTGQAGRRQGAGTTGPQGSQDTGSSGGACLGRDTRGSGAPAHPTPQALGPTVSPTGLWSPAPPAVPQPCQTQYALPKVSQTPKGRPQARGAARDVSELPKGRLFTFSGNTCTSPRPLTENTRRVRQVRAELRERHMRHQAGTRARGGQGNAQADVLPKHDTARAQHREGPQSRAHGTPLEAVSSKCRGGGRWPDPSRHFCRHLGT